jgi:hypothetical protein
VTIRVPAVPANKDDNEIRRDKKTIEEFQAAIVSRKTSYLNIQMVLQDLREF